MKNNKQIKKVKLFCVPYSGGYASIFNKWKVYLDKSIDLFPVELAGRGKRCNEPLYKSFEEAVIDITNIISKNIGNNNYALFGHSLGSLLIYESYYRLLANNHIKPVHIFFSGSNPPHFRMNDKSVYNLPKDQFIKYLKKLGGISEEFLENEEIINFFLPVIRTDLMLYNSYKFDSNRMKLNCNISILYGTEDEIVNEFESWQKYTDLQCYFYKFKGNHFFIHEYTEAIVKIINKTLLKL